MVKVQRLFAKTNLKIPVCHTRSQQGLGLHTPQQEHYRSPTNVRTLAPNSNKQRQGIIMAMVSCLLLFLTAYGILGLVQQIGTCRGEAPPSCCARPFCRLKAPLGLSLLRYASQTRTCRGEAPPSCCARPFCRLKAPLGLSLLRCANANNALFALHKIIHRLA